MNRKDFVLAQTEIGAGSLLIEASAGTGKTFTIAGLVLRLLLERPGLTIGQILVTTFTELATAELRGRIRARLRDALLAFQTRESEDELIGELLKKHPAHQAAAETLQHALAHFDEAPIYTIHGFCQRVLADQAFETGTLFDAELVTDERSLLREVTWDFWRRNFYSNETLGALLAVQKKITPQKLLADLEELLKNPTLTILPEDPISSADATVPLEKTLNEVRAIWVKYADGVRAFFASSRWAKKAYQDAALRARVLEDLDQLVSDGTPSARQFASIELLAAEVIGSKGLKKGATLPDNPIFDVCQKFVDRAEEFCVALRVEFHRWAPEELRQRKQDQNVLAFEDLLTRLEDALCGPDGPALAQSIRQKYPVALVDEFQDTDPVQYEIFQKIYPGNEATVAFIGDPKQAIYGFRGADVFTYLNAAQNTPGHRQYTLRTNWRSESGLVRAINAVFDQENSFHLEKIQFQPAEPGPQADRDQLLFGKERERPLQIWSAASEEKFSAVVASEIVRLLGRGATIDGKKLEPAHFAVLTSTNADAAEMQVALRARRVPSVLYSSANVFASREAHELRAVLAAVAQPGREKLVRAALCTDALGGNGNQIEELAQNDAAWETELLRFQKHHELWRTRGFIQMLRELAVAHGLRQRLLGYPDGERRLTNFLHLSELLHTACVEHRLGLTGMLKWLAEQMQTSHKTPREECELRLESDEKAVRIITVHKSKGLEFDIVFCPYVWSPAKLRKPFHDPDHDHRLTLDLVESNDHKDLQEKEALAEALRLFYVAITRARHRCTMVWKAKKKTARCATSYLLGEGAQPTLTSAEIAIAELPQPNDDSFRPDQPTASPLEARRFTGTRIDCSWGTASFTRLVRGREADPLDESWSLEPAAEEAPEAQGIHAFPKGMRAGTCLHEILEQVNFADLTTAPEIIEHRLRAYAIPAFDQVVEENVRQLALLPLPAGKNRFSLSEVPHEARLAELEFSFPINALTIAKLAEVFRVSELPLPIERLQFQLVNGFMNGFIDLTFAHEGRFYFADWKSNWLGPTPAAYRPATIAAEMQRNFYSLQLCLYSVALHRYLGLRQPGYDFDRHFGGAFYIFLRGLDPARPANGVHFERPSRAFVEKLSGIFDP